MYNVICLEGDIELAENECMQLIKEGQFDSQFTRYSTVEFSDALYSPSYPPDYHYRHSIPRGPGPTFPPVAEPVIDEPCVTEEMPQSANGE